VLSGFFGLNLVLESISVFVLINESLTKEFSPLKGLRQGGPFASLLFLIAAEGLAGVSKKADEIDCLESLEIGSKKVRVNMLHYANDTFFFQANTKSVFIIKVILSCFELVSGLKVNFLKNSIRGVGVDPFTIRGFAVILNCDVKKTPFKYLGMPVGGAIRGKLFELVWLKELNLDWGDGKVEYFYGWEDLLDQVNFVVYHVVFVDQE